MKIIEETYKWANTNFTKQTPKRIVIHHAAHPNCTAQDIHRWHLDNGWKGIAYHYFIRKNGSVYRGRQEEWQGGGLLGDENKDKIQICLEGCYTDYVSAYTGQPLTEKTVPEAQMNALVELCRDIMKRWTIDGIDKHADYPSAQKEKKNCPGKYFPWDEFMKRMSIPTIMGEPDLTVAQMRKFLRNVNPNAPEGIEEMYLEEGRIEGVRGDIAFCQAIHETNYFRFTGIAKPEWHNPAGLGVTGAKDSNGEYVGNKFPDWRIGVRANIQHLKAYASTEPLNNPCVDQRFSLVKRGSAITWTDLNGKWAVPGTTYGQSILALYEKIKAIPVETDSDKIKALEEENARLKNEVTRLNNLLSEIEIVLHKR